MRKRTSLFSMATHWDRFLAKAESFLLAGRARFRCCDWNAAKPSTEPVALAAFAATPEGVQWLRQLPILAKWYSNA